LDASHSSPLQIKYGSLDSLAVKIPWQDIYTQPTVAKVVGLQAIIVPSRGVPFDEESTSSRQNEIKQKQLNRLENNRRKIRSGSNAGRL
jgi:vacuolar protein sorting-associated protein 13A/C